MASNCYNTNQLKIQYLTPIYAAEFIIGFLCNLLVILGYVFCLRSSKSINVYMFNLAISDLIFLCTLPVLIYSYMHNMDLPPVSCVVTRFILHVNLYASIFFMVWVGVDRLLLLWFPQRNHFLLTRKASLFISFLSWILVTLEIAPQINFFINDLKKNNWTKCNDFANLYETEHVLAYSLLLTTVGYVLPLLTLYMLSSRMVSLLKNRQEVLGTSFQRPVCIVKAAAVMMLVFYMPIHLMRIIFLASKLPVLEPGPCTVAYIEVVYIIIRPIAFAHSVINPVFYGLMTDRFREVMQDKWKQFKRWAKI